MIDRVIDAYFEGRWLKWLVPFAIGFLLGATCAANAEPPDEATKREALLWAYRANGNSMVSYGAWDYTTKQQLTIEPREVPAAPLTTIPKTPKKASP